MKATRRALKALVSNKGGNLLCYAIVFSSKVDELLFGRMSCM